MNLYELASRVIEALEAKAIPSAFQTMRKPTSCFLFCAFSVAAFAADPPGIPEPPLVATFRM